MFSFLFQGMWVSSIAACVCVCVSGVNQPVFILAYIKGFLTVMTGEVPVQRQSCVLGMLNWVEIQLPKEGNGAARLRFSILHFLPFTPCSFCSLGVRTVGTAASSQLHHHTFTASVYTFVIFYFSVNK